MTSDAQTVTTAAPELAIGPDPRVIVRDVSLAFDGRAVLEGLNLSVEHGEFVVLLGPSGTGKTSLLRILAGLQRPDSGEVLVPERTTYVYQEPRLIPSKRVIDNVTIGLPKTAAVREEAERALAEVGLVGRERSWPSTLSGGEAQRAALARALIRHPQLLLLDEPLAALDALKRRSMQNLLADLIARRCPAVVLVTHEIDEALRLADRVLVLNGGKVAYEHRIDIPRTEGSARLQQLELRHRLLNELHVQ